MIPGKKFDPATETSRRPTPEKFEHLRKWVEPVKRDIKIVSISEMTNINQQLEQNAELFVDNIISRVIAQLIGKYGDGFVTIEATSDGKLKVEAALAALTTVGLEAGSNKIGEVNVVGREHTVLQAAIDFSQNTDKTVIENPGALKIKIVNIFFTVEDDVTLTFKDSAGSLSGAMMFGGTNEPRGMVVPFGRFPMETAGGEDFIMRTDVAKQVSGYVNYYLEA